MKNKKSILSKENLPNYVLPSTSCRVLSLTLAFLSFHLQPISSTMVECGLKKENINPERLGCRLNSGNLIFHWCLLFLALHLDLFPMSRTARYSSIRTKLSFLISPNLFQIIIISFIIILECRKLLVFLSLVVHVKAEKSRVFRVWAKKEQASAAAWNRIPKRLKHSSSLNPDLIDFYVFWIFL